MSDGIKHHLTDDLLMGYATGNLPEAFSLVVATHVSLCDECRARLGSFEEIGGALIEADASEVAPDALEKTLRMIEGGPSEPIRVSSAQTNTVFPAPLREYAGGDLAEVKWRAIPGGVKQAVLKTSQDATVRLLAIPGGVAMPDHGHRGTELTMVLQGAFHDEEDRFGRGDIEIADEDLNHTPVAEAGQTCICLAATDAPLRFRGLIPRIAQPFFGI